MRGVRQGESTFGQSDELDRSRGGVGEDQAHGIGETDVLAGEDDESSREEPRALAALEHRDQPVERAVGVRSAHRLDEGADLVEVRVARLVIEATVARLGDVFDLDEVRRRVLARAPGRSPCPTSSARRARHRHWPR